ncbi:hypothetical protein AFB00_09515 [Pseudonocardia sp. HH130630-07]|nr:hypothetical protein AFB00_09515 [Pseudonocardia sp. HH130630-07]
MALAPEGPGNIDVVELDAASHGGVEDARELRDRAFYAPAESRYRVFVVDEAHMVTNQGFNALLKIVEEPPEHLVFIFATTEPEKVLPTIRSRTHHYPFRLIPPGTMRSLLERICGDEEVTVAPPVFPLVIRAGGGSARDTLSVLDQLIAGAGPEGVTYERAVALLGVTDSGLIDDAVDALAAADGAAVYGAVDRLVEAGHDPRRFASDLLQRFRDLMLLQVVPDAAEQGLVDGAADELTRMADQAALLGPAALTRYGEILHQGLVEMRGATAPRLLLELLCARMLLPAATMSDGGLLERLERIERRNAIAPEPAGGEGAPAKRFVRASERGGEAPEPPSRPDAGAADPGARSGGQGAPARRGGASPVAAVAAVAPTVVDGNGGPAQEPGDGSAAGPEPAGTGAAARVDGPTGNGPAAPGTPPARPADGDPATGPEGTASGSGPATTEDGSSAAADTGPKDTGPEDTAASPAPSGPGETAGSSGSGTATPAPGADATGATDQGSGDPTPVGTGPGTPGTGSGAAAPSGSDGSGSEAAGSTSAGPGETGSGEAGSGTAGSGTAGSGTAGSGTARPDTAEPDRAGTGSGTPRTGARTADAERTGSGTAAEGAAPAVTDHPEPPRDGAPADAVPPTSAQPAPAVSSLDATAVRRVWPEVLAAVRQRSRSTEALLVNATVRAIDGDTLVLAIGAPPLARRLSEQRNTDVISDALRAVLGVQWQVRCDQGEAGGAARRAAPERQPRPVPQRPSQQRGASPERGSGGGAQGRGSGRAPGPDGDIPLPPEPPPDDAPPDPAESGGARGGRSAPVQRVSQADAEEAMLAEAAAEAAKPGTRRDPEAAALGILEEHLGARTVEPK